MSSLHEIYVSFGIWGLEGVTPDELTQMIGVTPTISAVKGEALKNGNHTEVAESTFWKIESPLTVKSLQISVEEKLDALIGILEPHKEFLKELCLKCESEFSFTVYINTDSDESTPSMHLNPDHVSFISYLNAECDFDIILVSDTMPEGYDVDDW